MPKQSRKRHKSSESTSSINDSVNNEQLNDSQPTPRTLRKKTKCTDENQKNVETSDKGDNYDSISNKDLFTSTEKKDKEQPKENKNQKSPRIHKTDESKESLNPNKKEIPKRAPNSARKCNLKKSKERAITEESDETVEKLDTETDATENVGKSDDKHETTSNKEAENAVQNKSSETTDKPVFESSDRTTKEDESKEDKTEEKGTTDKAECTADKAEEKSHTKEESLCKRKKIMNKMKHKTIPHKPTDTMMDLFNNTITICIEEEDSDAESQDEIPQREVDENMTSAEGEADIEKDTNTRKDKEKEDAVVVLNDDSADVETAKQAKNLGDKIHEEGEGESTNPNDQNEESVEASVQNDHALQHSFPTWQQSPTEFTCTGQLINLDKDNSIQDVNSESGTNILDLRTVNPNEEDELAAARLMTDMAGNRVIAQHSNLAETNVTNSGYGYCSSGDHGSYIPGYNRFSIPYQGNFSGALNVPPGMWHPGMFGQDPYNQWEGNFQNIAMYDSNNNIINQGQHLFQSQENSQYAQYNNMGIPVRMSGSNEEHRMLYEVEKEDSDSHDRVQHAFKPFQSMAQGIPIDYTMPHSQNLMGMMGQNVPLGEVGNFQLSTKRQVRKIVVLDPKHGKRPSEEDIESPVKRRKRSRNSQVSQESMTNYDEIVKNLFVPAPPTKTVLIQPKFLNKGSNGNDVDTTKVRSISHRGLIQKYIDYLITENEYITEISKAVSLPMENCVMDDPYLMDVIRIKIPFPTPKYMQFLKDFYPSIQVDWRALNHQLEQYRSGGDGADRFHSYYLDNRAVPVLLGEAFYFFQRESDRKAVAANQAEK